MRYAFTFDASACTGCKSCQVACKDKNALPLGVLWRRVYEVTGGSWERRGSAWTNTVFAYNVSVGCNHCEDPACASACPADAYTIRDDGLVWLDAKKCIGCEYCAWACPYSAPQYSDALGHMTKCDGCMDLIDQGLPPSCTSSCPMRALDFVRIDQGGSEERLRRALVPSAFVPSSADARALWQVPAPEHLFPFPPVSRTKPHVVLTPHTAMLNALPKAVANREEIRPAKPSTRRGAYAAMDDLPLVAFTLFGQAASGTAIVSFLLAVPLDPPLLVVIGVLGALATAASLCHLGTVSRALRAPLHTVASPLSREIVLLGLFGAGWLIALVTPSVGHPALALTGAALVYTMGEVYRRIDVVPGWTTWRTHASFAFSAILLGSTTVLAVSAAGARGWLFILIAAGIVAQQTASRLQFYRRRSDKVM